MTTSMFELVPLKRASLELLTGRGSVRCSLTVGAVVTVSERATVPLRMREVKHLEVPTFAEHEIAGARFVEVEVHCGLLP